MATSAYQSFHEMRSDVTIPIDRVGEIGALFDLFRSGAIARRSTASRWSDGRMGIAGLIEREAGL